MSNAKWCDYGQHSYGPYESGIGTFIHNIGTAEEPIEQWWDACHLHIPTTDLPVPVDGDEG